MTLTTPYVASFAVGDGETREFPYTFDELNANFIQVRVYNVNGTVTAPTFIPDVDLKKVVFGEESPTPTADDVVCIFRQTPVVQDTPFRTLEGYNAKALENILSKIVAMIQEVKAQYVSTPAIQGEPWQLELLTSDDDGATLKIDYVARRFRKGLYFQITDGNLQVSADGSNYITMPKSVDIAEFRQFSITLEDLSVIKKLQYRVGNEWFDAETNAQATADEALALAQTVQSGLSSHVSDTNNPHQTSLVNLKDTNINTPVAGQFIMFDGLKWKNVYSSASASWGTILGNITDQTDLMNKFTEYVRTDGTSVMTAPLLMRATDDFKCAIAPYWDGIGFFKLNDNNSVTLMASIEYNSGFEPATTNTYNIGALTRKWKNLYLSGKAYVSVINNGYDIAVPVTNSSDTLALKSEVDLAANSGSQLYTTGVWYAKMYAATVVPTGAEYNGRKYADFSQVDSDNNPVIKIYTGASGAWTLTETITPPANYNGYITVTSKIWDIAEQAGQQGGEVLWDYTHKTFTPYPKIVSFESINVTGNSTVVMPATPTDNSIPSKKYIDDLIASLDVPELFDWKWKDCTTSRTTWALSDGNWVTDKSDAYQHLVDDVENKATSSVWGWRKAKIGGGYDYMYTESQDPNVGDPVYQSISDGASLWVFYAGVVDSVSMQSGHVHDITVGSYTYGTFSDTPQARKIGSTETVSGTTIQFYLADDGHKICPASEESNVTAIYNATGVAWYYILDTANQRFKLPRSKHNKYANSLSVVGNGKSLGLTDGTHNFGVANQNNTAALMLSSVMYGQPVDTNAHTTTNNNGAYGITTDGTKSGMIAQQEQDTDQYKYLYFYVGN